MTRPGPVRLRALITNDDGIASEGLRQLAIAARAAGLDVVVAAPRDEASGSSAAITSVQRDGSTVVEERELPDLEGAPCYAVAAAPAFIARMACRGGFGPAPDLVLSGINRGANMGQAVLHSGTVGAALTAHLEGRRAMAVSLAGRDPQRWATAAHVATIVLDELLDGDSDLVLNVNVPDVAIGDLRGLRHARLAHHGAVQTTIVETGRGHVEQGLEESGPELDRRSDVALLSDGFATVTALESVSERSDVSLDELRVPRAS